VFFLEIIGHQASGRRWDGSRMNMYINADAMKSHREYVVNTRDNGKLLAHWPVPVDRTPQLSR